MQDFAIQNSYSKYSLNDVGIISFTDEKTFTVTTLTGTSALQRWPILTKLGHKDPTLI